MPPHVGDDRLLGGLDLAATLAAGRPVAERGLLAAADGGVLVLPMAERHSAGTVARIAAALDLGWVAVERDGLAARAPARFAVVALDEGIEDERPAAALIDRLAFHIAFDPAEDPAGEAALPRATQAEVAAARARLPAVGAEDQVRSALVATALALGIASLRAPLLDLRAARAAAALDGTEAVGADHAALAASLVLAPRATAVPVDTAAVPDRPAEEPEPDTRADDAPPPDVEFGERPLEDVVLAAATAALPPDLLARLRLAGSTTEARRSAGGTGAEQKRARRGRPAGIRSGDPGPGARLNVLETLRAAAPWQRLRRAERPSGPTGRPERIAVRRDDFRVTRLRQRAGTTAIFAVDASGSAVLHRLAEVKGAVELLLADCYVRRDEVALIAFRGRDAAVLLPPTRALARARRGLAAIPGGGATPLASGLAAVMVLAATVRRGGQTPLIVCLTDGRANIARDGAIDRLRAESDALAVAGAIRIAGYAVLLVDTAPRPTERAARLATAMAAAYLPLPRADAGSLSRAVRATQEGLRLS